jgi:hypothetical protein
MICITTWKKGKKNLWGIYYIDIWIAAEGLLRRKAFGNVYFSLPLILSSTLKLLHKITEMNDNS